MDSGLCRATGAILDPTDLQVSKAVLDSEDRRYRSVLSVFRSDKTALTTAARLCRATEA